MKESRRTVRTGGVKTCWGIWVGPESHRTESHALCETNAPVNMEDIWNTFLQKMMRDRSNRASFTVSLARPVAYHHCGASVTHPVAPQPFNLTATQSATNVFLQTCPSSGLCIYAPASSLGKPIDGFTKRRLYVYMRKSVAKPKDQNL